MKFAVAILLCSQLVHAADPLAESARQKLASIKAEKLAPGTIVPITAQEWNAWVKAEIADEPEIGLRDPKIGLGQGTVTFEVIADFGKLAAKANGSGIFAQMLAGERPVKITARPDTANGKITVHLDSAEISGVTLNGVLLKLVAELVISRLFDDVKIDQPSDLPHKVDHATIEPAQTQFFIGPLQAQPPQPSRR